MNHLDRIIIADLEVHYRVGVPDEERAKPQRLLLTVELELDFTRAAAADQLVGTVDYDAVCRRLQSLGDGRSWRLIETVACELAADMLKVYAAQAVTVEVKKFVIPETRYVAVRVRRER